jgi:hypothetical protein
VIVVLPEPESPATLARGHLLRDVDGDHDLQAPGPEQQATSKPAACSREKSEMASAG